MDFGFTAENNAFREEVRQFIVDTITPEVQAELKQSRLKRPGPLTKQLLLKLGEHGWIGMSWPKEYGGEEAPLEQLGLLLEEMGRALAPFRSWGRRKSSGHGGGLRQMAGGVWAANRGVSVHSAHVCRYGHLGRWRVSFDVRSVVEIKSWTTG